MSQEIINKYKIWAKKSLGQNFLVDESKVQEIANTLKVSWKSILEVGPGYWALTEKLLEKNPSSLHLVELDLEMVDILEERKSDNDLQVWEVDFQIHNQDVLKFTPNFQEYSVIANIPYYITSPILRHFLYSLENSPEKMLILMQQDVGDRILQKHKNKSSVLSLIVQKKCKVSEKHFVPKECFSPIPKVESSVLLFELYDLYSHIDDESFLKLIKAWFSAARKKCIKNLIAGGYDSSKIKDFFAKKWFSENIRAEDLGVDEWCELLSKI